MKPSTTLRQMMADSKIVVPAYQRAYSWDTPEENSDRKSQTDVFLKDLEEHCNNNATSAYYLGHFLFEEKSQYYNVIDGQQRLTTCVIFLAALFAKLKTIRECTEEEEICYEDMVKRRSTIRFLTVDYDENLFIDYVIDQSKNDHNGIETESARRIVTCFDYFKKQLESKSESYLVKMLSVLSKTACTTHLVQDESEAIQMFIFHNNRGKRPSNLEIVKAQFMYHVHIYCGDETDRLVHEIRKRFEDIYKSIATIEYKVNEDEVLLYTQRVYFNSLWETNSLGKINKILENGNSIDFIQSFTRLLAECFKNLSLFYQVHERTNFAIHSLITLKGIGIAIPFILKAYSLALTQEDIAKLCSAFESLILRHKVIGTRADITSRVSDVYEGFGKNNQDISPILNRIEWMKTTDDWWWAYWSDDKLRESLQHGINHSIGKFLLWKYEIYLEGQGKAGYLPSRFDRVTSPELEHIAPVTEPNYTPTGYDTYDDEFRNKYLDCLGNYLLLSKSHNCAVGNIPFFKKWETYDQNEQQREVQNLIPKDGTWDRTVIQVRKDKIANAIMTMY